MTPALRTMLIAGALLTIGALWLTVPPDREAPEGPCTDPAALAVMAEVRKPGWVVGKLTASHASGLSIWLGNEDYGLGVSSDGSEAMPDDGPHFSEACKAAIYRLVKAHLIDPWEAEQRAQVMRISRQ